MDAQQRIVNREEIEKLHADNIELKKELEKEQVLHNMLYKEWKQLSEETSAREQEAYENSQPKNLFYKYGFYVLLIAGIPAAYWAFSHVAGPAKIPSSSQFVGGSQATANDTTSAISSASFVNDSLSKQKPLPTIQAKPSNSRDSIHQTAVLPTVIKPVEKKAVLPDSAKEVRAIVHEPLVEKLLTDSDRDSITSDGFNAYFEHRLNPFRKSSGRYKIWEDGWNQGKAEAKKVLEKNPTLK
ncbi:MAG: hypothetical protein ABI472_23200 [Ginsengibacter sp.]